MVAAVFALLAARAFSSIFSSLPPQHAPNASVSDARDFDARSTEANQSRNMSFACESWWAHRIIHAALMSLTCLKNLDIRAFANAYSMKS